MPSSFPAARAAASINGSTSPASADFPAARAAAPARREPDLAPVSPALEHPDICLGRDLPDRLAVYRAAGLRIVFTNGCFDVLHPGHMDLLTRARRLGDVLVLGLNTDDSVRRLGKGAGRPVNPLAVRAFMAAHLRAVDCVTAFAEDTPEALIRIVRPDVLVKGGDWPVECIAGADFVRAYGGAVYSLPLLAGYSTTAFLASVRG